MTDKASTIAAALMRDAREAMMEWTRHTTKDETELARMRELLDEGEMDLMPMLKVAAIALLMEREGRFK